MSKKRIGILTAAIFFTALMLIFAIASNNTRAYSKECYYFDTYNYITVYGKKDYKKLDDVISKIAYYDSLFDKDREGSDIYNINHSQNKPVTVSEDTYKMLEKAYEFCDESNGAADITVEPLMNLWGFENDGQIRTEVPTDSEIEKSLFLIDYKNLILSENNTVILEGENTKIDVGFIAKGYIADCIKEYMESIGIKRGLISLGGNILAIGQKPFDKPYIIGVRDPENKSESLREIEIDDESLVTSGTYERFIEIDGTRFHHILDINTGYPVENGINGVTVKAKSSADADALSTICLILGEEKSRPILERHNAEAVFY